ncbi:ETEC_3214 domain-containing protein [Nocardia sp. CA-135398]|uniref:ETEC_3214 domain-containing protein n=1 Tax=Nocardia sp. CA-135398 TaxID=3239977 RepID=UPI003D960321
MGKPNSISPKTGAREKAAQFAKQTKKLAKRIWSPFQSILKSILMTSALIAAITLILQFTPGVWRNINWRPVEYSILNELHAGYDIEYFESKLGKPTITDMRHQDAPDWRQLTFVRREYFVNVIVSESGRVEAYSVVTCNLSFRPTFNAPDRSQVTLNSAPLAHSQKSTSYNKVRLPHGEIRQITSEEINNARYLSYWPGRTVSSPDSYLEADPSNGANSMGGRGTYVGISSACIATWKYPDIFRSGEYKGWIAGAPPGVVRVRENVAANLYCETAPYSPLFLVDNGQFTFVQNRDRKSASPTFDVGPYWGELHASLRNSNGTRVFNQ